MSILIAEDNVAQRRYLRELLEREFAAHLPVIEAEDGEATVELALAHRPRLCVLDIQMPRLSGVKAARTIWRSFPTARIIFWTQFPHEIYINEIRKIIRSVNPPPAYGFIDKNNPESRFLRFVAAVLEDGADMIDPAFKDSFKRPLLTEFEAEALYYLALGLSNWAIARKCSLSLRGVESRLATLYEKLFASSPVGTANEAYDKLAYNVRTRAFFEALRRGLLNSDELQKAAGELDTWIERDRKAISERVMQNIARPDIRCRGRACPAESPTGDDCHGLCAHPGRDKPCRLQSHYYRPIFIAQRFSFIIFVALLISLTSLSAENTVSTSNLHQWGAVTLFHGLPSNHVRAIAQDGEGMMWFGTDGGLAKYDGRRIQKMVVDALPAGRVRALKLDGDGVLWVGTDSGAARLVAGEFKPIAETEGKAVTAIILPERGRAVMVSEQGTVFDCSTKTDGSLAVQTIEPRDSALLNVDSEWPRAASTHQSRVD